MKKNVPHVLSLLLNKVTSFILLLLFLLSGGISYGQVVINTTQNWTVPAGVTTINVNAWGGGGGGGGAWIGTGGGGGGGAYNFNTYAVTPGQTISIVIGAGGGSGSNGGNTTVSRTAAPAFTLTANGGSAGEDNIWGFGGTGGNGATGITNGGNGASGGAGGGGAGNSGNGSNASGSTGGTGGTGVPNAAPYIGGNGGNFNNGGGNGGNGAAPGGGGGGANSTSFFSPADGGSGGQGRVVITYSSGPAVTGFTNPACVGQTITITGSNFTNPASVTFYNGLNVPATVVNSGTITAVLPAGASTGGLTVTTSTGTSAISAALTVQNLTTPLSTTGAGTYCGSASISATGGSGGSIYFQGTNASGTSTAQGSPQTISTAGTATYYFRELTACGWGTAYGVNVTVNPLPSAFSVTVAATCNSALLTPSGAAGDIFYFQGNTANGTSTSLPGAQTVSSPGTYYYRARTAAGCWGPDVPVNVVFVVTAAFTSHPSSQSVCVGANVIFSVTASSGSPLTYKWRRGNTDLVNGGGISGVNTNSLQIANVNAGHAATDYNCLITDACSSIPSNFATLTVNTPAVAPTTAATAMLFPTVGATGIYGTFTASSTATDYLVVRSNTATALSPVNGTNYTVGSTVFGANTYVEYVGPNTYFTSSGLNPNQTYYFHVFPFNTNNCAGSPYNYYRTPALIGSVLTATNTTCPASRVKLYWAGTGSAGTQASGSTAQKRDFTRQQNWSLTYPGYSAAGVVPTRCNDVEIHINGDITMTLNNDMEFYDLTFDVTGNNVNAVIDLNNNNLTVWGNSTINTVSGNANTSIGVGELDGTDAPVLDFKGNVRMGTSGTNGTSSLLGNQNCRIIVRGDLEMGPRFALSSSSINTTLPGTLELDGTIQQLRWNNSNYAANFRNIIIGNQNNPRVIMGPGSQIPDNIRGNITINGSSILDLGTSQWNRLSAGGTFTMNGTSTLILGAGSSATNEGATPVSGSNFPAGFTSVLNANSTIEYNAAGGVTQTIFRDVTYRNLTLSRSSGSSVAPKIHTNTFTVQGTTHINNGAQLTVSSTITSNGTFNVQGGGSLIIGTQMINGTGAFNLNNGSAISTASTSGITSSGAAGSIQSTGTRTYQTGANYTYNGTAAQHSGNGLPATVNDLTINNSNGVTLNSGSASHTISGTLYQTAGALEMNGKTITVNNISRNSGVFTGSHAGAIIVNGSNIPLFFNTATAANSTLKTLVLNDNKTAYVGTALDITAGQSLNDAGSVTIGSGAILSTNDNLTLKSGQLGTASVKEIPVNGAGLALGTISGKISIERYIPAYRAWRFLAAPVKKGVGVSPTVQQSWQELGNPTGNGYGTNITGPEGAAHGFNSVSPSYSMKWFDAVSNNYINIRKTTDSLIANDQGYMVFVRGNRTVGPTDNPTPTNLRIKGELRTGNQVFNLSAGQFHSIGNPYASAVSMEAVFTDPANAGISQTYIAWDPSLSGSYFVGGYQYISRLGPDPYEASSPGTALYGVGETHPNIQSGQAIFVTNVLGTATTVTFRESMKATGSDLVSRENTPADRQFMSSRLYSANGEIADGNFVAFDDEFSNTQDGDDAVKFGNSGENWGMARFGKTLAIEARKRLQAADTIFYHMSNLREQVYKLKLIPKNLATSGMEGYFVDRFLNTQTPVTLTDTTVLNLTITSNPASKAANRFMLVFKPATVLPVTILSVSATRNNDRSIAVRWKTESEINMAKYEVERSKDGAHFSSILSTDPTATNGGSAVYLQTDLSPLAADNFYRIKAISLDGQVQYSAIVKVAAQAAKASIAVYPNPVENKTMNISFVGQQKGRYSIELYSTTGQLVYKGSVSVNSNNSSEMIALDKNLAAGHYQLRVTAEAGDVNTQTVLIQ